MTAIRLKSSTRQKYLDLAIYLLKINLNYNSFLLYLKLQIDNLRSLCTNENQIVAKKQHDIIKLKEHLENDNNWLSIFHKNGSNTFI